MGLGKEEGVDKSFIVSFWQKVIMSFGLLWIWRGHMKGITGPVADVWNREKAVKCG